MTGERAWRGLYAITDSGLVGTQDLGGSVRAALEGGACVVQYRDKSRGRTRRLREATELLRLCHSFRVPLIINDDVELAAAIGADGVHLGRQDPDIRQARKRLGRGAICGVSCYNELSRATSAQDAGADYLAFGRFFPSSTKPDAVTADLALLRAAKQRFRLPLVAIGGITPENGGTLIRAGADLLAVVHGVFGQPDIRAAARAFASLF
jgi:thiamine-phosphate pyrophosphorylase